MFAILCALFFVSPILCGDFLPDPAVIIRRKILEPEAAIKQLSTLTDDSIRNYHDEEHNNLLHIAVKTLLFYKDNMTYNKRVENSKSLLMFLAKKGVKINEENDEHATPYFYAEQECPLNPRGGMREIRDRFDRALTNYLKTELGADPTYSSFEPDIRAFKKKMNSCKQKICSVVCCKSKRRK